ncbi:MAG: DUF5930 domain-containing protein [Alphaproteobacteria bacterium]
MAKISSTEDSGRKRRWFARRQVYLRSGQDSQYVELSPMLQIGVALGFGALGLWLAGASYAAITGVAAKDEQATLLDRLNITERQLGQVARERDVALEDTARIPDLELALADARAMAADLSQEDEAGAMTAELEQTKLQLEELQQRFSETKADHAALQAKFEAEVVATSDASEKTAEEAASLHAQLEKAFAEMEILQEQRDALAARLDTVLQEKATRDETIDRNTALLKAATAEIERLQETLQRTETAAEDSAQGRDEASGKLEQALAERGDLEREVAGLQRRLEEAEAKTAAMEKAATIAQSQSQAATDASFQAQSITAGLKEADLLATIDDLRAKLDGLPDQSVDAAIVAERDDEIVDLREQLSMAESEIERLLLSGLRAAEEEDKQAARPTEPEDPGEAEHLRAELLAAQADIIKLNADVKAAKQRLAEQAPDDNGQAARPDNSAKLEQQLASTRSRVQQLNKALADAKLREVAIDLALINVIPTPSPPAPR